MTGGTADDQDDDRVIANEGEELDDDVFVQEGYASVEYFSWPSYDPIFTWYHSLYTRRHSG